MASRDNLGMKNQLVVIIEGLVDFEEMMAHGFDLQRVEMVEMVSLIFYMVLLTLI